MRIIAGLTVFLLLCCARIVAGTTGAITGTVLDDQTSARITDARVTASSAVQVSSALTDHSGRFTFASLPPERYTITIEKSGYEPTARQNIRVFSDQTVSVAVAVHQRVTEIAHVSARRTTDLVRAATTSDIYSVDEPLAQAARALGGGGGLNNAYSAIAAVPGTFVPQGQQGYAQAVFIRGGDSDQVGYEYDGVPMNRAFDNLPAHTAAAIGQQEVQIYTSGGPPSSTATGLSGFINQVIRTGTYPGYGAIEAGVGSPAFYHQLSVEASGASPDRGFSYYGGFTGYNQDFRVVDQWNGGGVSFPYYATVIASPASYGLTGGAAPSCVNGLPPSTLPAGIATPSCYAFGPGNLGYPSSIADREGVFNIHFVIPYRNGTKDDLQFLVNVSALNANVYDSQSDAGTATIAQAFGGPFTWADGIVFPRGTRFGEPVAAVPVTGTDVCPAPSRCDVYFFPSSPRDRVIGAPIPLDQRGGQQNDAAIFKLQYQRNFGSSGYLRVFGYSFYSDFLENDPNVPIAALNYDYELSTHTRGAELQFVKELSSLHLIKTTFNYTTATTSRFNNMTMFNGPGSRVTNLVDADGNCYDAAGAIAACNGFANEGSFANPSPYVPTGSALQAHATWIVTGARKGFFESGTFNTVAPRFTSISFEDDYKPNDKVFLNLGLRAERFSYDMGNSQTPDVNFWFAAAQREFCYDPTTFEPDDPNGAPLATVPGATCPINPVTGAREVHPDGKDGHLLLSNMYGSTLTSNVLSPRVAATYSVVPDTVLRAAYGVYSEPADSAHTQFLQKQPNLPRLIFPVFWRYGFNTPRHDVQPEIANTYDFSYERHFKGTDMSLKVTLFLRATRDQRQNLFLSLVPPFVTALNVGHQTSWGVEVAFRAGDFSRDGLAASISYTYTNARLRYDDYPNTDHNSIDIINDQIKRYNELTGAGGGSPCYRAGVNGSGTGETAAQCAADAMAIENPYFRMAPQPLLDPNGSYVPFDILSPFWAGISDSFYSPNVIAAVAQYRRRKLAVIPSVQFNAGTFYGSPVNTPGIDPTNCSNNSAAAGIRAPNSHQADYTSCATIAVPDSENNNHFDAFGQWQNPAQLSVNLQVGYDLSSHVSANVILTNLYATCFGGSVTPWSRAAPPGASGVCGYGSNGFAPFVSNLYNGFGPNDAVANGAPLNPYIAHAYQAITFNRPFQAFFELHFR